MPAELLSLLYLRLSSLSLNLAIMFLRRFDWLVSSWLPIGLSAL
jgi:hypothetical protein